MPSTSTHPRTPGLQPWLDCMQQLAPPQGLLHIGAGASPYAANAPYPHSAMPWVLAVEANAERHAQLQSQLQAHPHCHVLHAVVAQSSGPALFHELSLAHESSLCPPEALRALWPNLELRQTREVQALSLCDLLAQTPANGHNHSDNHSHSHHYNWVYLDCLPAAALLSGAGPLLDTLDVLLLRATVATAIRDNSDNSDNSAELPAVQQLLGAHGLQCVVQEEEKNPAIVRALFVRNPAQALARSLRSCAALQQEKTEFGQTLNKARKAIEQAQAEIEALGQEKTALQSQLASLQQAQAQQQKQQQAQQQTQQQEASAAQEAQHKQWAQEKNLLTQTAATQTKAIQQAQAEIEALGQEKTALQSQLASLQQAQAQQQAQLQKSQEQLAAYEASTAQRQAELQALQQETLRWQQRSEQWEAEQHATTQRQQQLQDELLRAEAQIELIKELLLQTPEP